jgi:hypothetical protein
MGRCWGGRDIHDCGNGSGKENYSRDGGVGRDIRARWHRAMDDSECARSSKRQGAVGYKGHLQRHDTHEDRRKHKVCHTISLLRAYADLADNEMFAYTHVEVYESDRT